jgi:hypothetical protein
VRLFGPPEDNAEKPKRVDLNTGSQCTLCFPSSRRHTALCKGVCSEAYEICSIVAVTGEGSQLDYLNPERSQRTAREERRECAQRLQVRVAIDLVHSERGHADFCKIRERDGRAFKLLAHCARDVAHVSLHVCGEVTPVSIQVPRPRL